MSMLKHVYTCGRTAASRWGMAVSLALLVLLGLRCDVARELGGVPATAPSIMPATAPSSTPATAPSSTPVFGYLIGYSNTRSTADAMEAIGASGYFAPIRQLKAGPQVLVEPIDNYVRHIEQALDAQITYAAENGLTPGFAYWMVGLAYQEDAAPTQEQTTQVFSLMKAIKNVVGEIPLIINPMSGYVDHVCEVAGTYGSVVAVALVDSMELGRGDRFNRIPAFPALAMEDTIDGCHATFPVYKRDGGLLVARIDSVLQRSPVRR